MKSWIAAALLAAAPALAHDGKVHGSVEEARKHAAETSTQPVGPDTPFPIKVGGAFNLIDQDGKPRTQVNPDGRLQMIFFGYANCQAICSVALPLMADAARALESQGISVQPVMITVDPERDTVETIGPALKEHHPGFIGLTGDEAALAVAYDAYSVEHKVVFEDPEYGPIFAHGSHIYLMDGQGAFLTLLPPILSTERVAEIVSSYATGGS